ncbi:hypothetical protein F5883DRAFT_654918 [Diaporthe sp. PMI_573]|nr:hypothetical protein F5883DRAFT_654918 [Diaporthaceae sp. PMI_573]
METERPTHPHSVGSPEDSHSPTASQLSSSERCGMNASPSTDTTAPASPTEIMEDSPDEESSLQDNDMDPSPSEPASIPKVDEFQDGTTPAPFANIFEIFGPLPVELVGREIRTTAVQLELDEDFFKFLSKGPLYMTVRLRDLNTPKNLDSALECEESFKSDLPIAGRSYNGVRVLGFTFYTHSMRVKEEGSYRLVYSFPFPDPKGFTGIKILGSSGFVTNHRPGFTYDQMKFIEEQERQGRLRLRQDGGLDILVARSG